MRRLLTILLSLLLTAPALAAKGPVRQTEASHSGLRQHVSTTSLAMPKLLPNLVPWPTGATMPTERNGIWRTKNLRTKDFFSRPVTDPNGLYGHDRFLDWLLKTDGRDKTDRNGQPPRRDRKSVVFIGGINWRTDGDHSSADNFDKSKAFRGEGVLSIANEQFLLRLLGGVPIRPNTDVKDLMGRIGEGPHRVSERAELDDLRVPKNARAIAMLDYYEFTDDKRINALIEKARHEPDTVFDLMIDPINEEREHERFSRIEKLQRAGLPNLRLWTSKLVLEQQLQHRKVFNFLVFKDIPKLAKGGGTTVFHAMAGVVPPPGTTATTEAEVRADLEKYGVAMVSAEVAKQMGEAKLKSIESKYPGGLPIIIQGIRESRKRTQRPTVAPDGALQFRGIDNLQALSNRYITKLADWSEKRNLRVRVRGQLFVATDRSFIEAVEYAIQKGGHGEFVVQNLRIPGEDGRLSDINQAGVEALVAAGADVRYFDAKQVPVPGHANDEDRKLHSKTYQVEVVDKSGKLIDWRRDLSDADRAAWAELWGPDYPDMPLGPFAVDGSANMSQAAKGKNFEIRTVTMEDPKAVKRVGEILHEPLFNRLSKPVQLARYTNPEGVPDLFGHPAARDAHIDDSNLVYIATNLIYLNDASDLFPIRAARGGNTIVKIGLARAGLKFDDAARTRLKLKFDDAARARPESGAVVINPGSNFAGDQRELSTGIDRFYGVNQDAARARPTMDRVLDDVVTRLRAFENSQHRPVLVTFDAKGRNVLDWYNQEGLRESLHNQFQIRKSTVTLDILEAIHALKPELRNMGRRKVAEYLGVDLEDTKKDAASAQILQMLPRVVELLRKANHKVDTLQDLEAIMRPGTHRWDRKSWKVAPRDDAEPRRSQTLHIRRWRQLARKHNDRSSQLRAAA